MIDVFSHLQVFLAVLIRTSGLLIVTPVVGGAEVPKTVKAILALAIAIVLCPVVRYDTFVPANSLMGFAALAAGELAVGMAIGFVVTLTFGALQIAGTLISRQMGFALANITDPTLKQETPLLSRFNVLFGTAVLLSFNGHHWFLQGLQHSFDRIQIGGLVLSSEICGTAATMFNSLFTAGVKLAAPLVCGSLLITVATGILARVAPQLNVMLLGISLRIGAGLVGMGLFLPYMAAFAQRLFLGMRNDIFLFIEVMRG